MRAIPAILILFVLVVPPARAREDEWTRPYEPHLPGTEPVDSAGDRTLVSVRILRDKPDATPARYHWRNSQDPVYVADPNDGGLRWDLREWTETPNWGDSP